MTGWLVPAVIFVVLGVASLLALRWIRSEHLETIRDVPLFSGLSDHELMSVLRSTHGEEFEPGDTVIREGERGKGFFVLTRGEADVSVDGKHVASLTPGSYFGEMAVIDDAPRAATITAKSPAFALVLPRGSLLRVIKLHPQIAQAFDVELRRRLLEVGEPVEPSEQVDERRLAELSARLRADEHPDWMPASGQPHRLRLSGLFARGSSDRP